MQYVGQTCRALQKRFGEHCRRIKKPKLDTFLYQHFKLTKAFKETSEEELYVVNGHCNHLALKFSVVVKERQDRLPTMYWLPKLHIKHDLLQTQVLVLQLNFLNY